MDINREIKRTVDTGKVILGTNKSINSLKTGNAKMIIYAQNCPKSIKEDILYYSKISNVPLLEFGDFFPIRKFRCLTDENIDRF